MFILTVLTLIHLAGVAAGLGGAGLAFLVILQRAVLAPIEPAAIARLEGLSRYVSGGLALLWISGVALVGIRYSMDPASIADIMLWAKVAVVALLTVGGMLVRGVIVPCLEARMRQRLFDLGTLKALAGVGLAAAFLTVSWVTPFILGAMSFLGSASPAFDVLQYYAWGIMAAWYGIMIVSMLTMQDREQAVGREAEVHLQKQNVLLRRRVDRMRAQPDDNRLAA